MHDENLNVHGVCKVRLQLGREGINVARCTVERLMDQLGLQGAQRGGRKPHTHTRAGGTASWGLPARDFTAQASNHRWIADFTYVPPSDTVYVAFAIDVYSA